MRRSFLCAATAFAIALTAYADDKIGDSKPVDVAKKVRDEMAKKKGYHVRMEINYPDRGAARANCKSPQSGIVKGDFAHLSKGTCYTFHKAEKFALR